MHRNIEDVEFTIFDTETTGLEPESGDRVIEIAGIRFKGDRQISIFNTLVNPHRQVSPGAFAVNKISQDMLMDAPDFSEIAEKFMDFVSGSVLCSYNAPFDMGFIGNELGMINRDIPHDLLVVDALKMSRRLLPGLERYSLWFISDKLGIKTKQEHRAFSDVEITREVFNKLKAIARAKGIFDLGSFLRLFGVSQKTADDFNSRRIAEISEAIKLGAKLKIKYFSSVTAEVTEREVVPKGIKLDKNIAFMVAYCFLRNEERLFRVDGILHLEIV